MSRHLRLVAPAWWEDMQINPVLLKGTEVQTKFDNEDELQQVDANLARVDGVYFKGIFSTLCGKDKRRPTGVLSATSDMYLSGYLLI